MEQANMMPNGVGAPAMNSMQRPQQGNVQQQLYAGIMARLRQKMTSLPVGWQTTYDIGQRANRIMQLISGLRVLNRTDTPQCINLAEQFEEKTIHSSPTAEIYTQRMDAKFQDVLRKRQTAAQNIPNAGQPNMGMQNNMGNMNNMQDGGMGNTGMDMGMSSNMQNGGLNMGNAAMAGLQMGGNGGQQNQLFPAHLQRPMQPSPLPQQQQTQSANGTMDPSALQMPQMQAQTSNMNQMNNQQSNTMQNGQNRQGGLPTGPEIQALARQMLTSIPEDKKNVLRQQYLSQMPEQQRMQFQSTGQDPIIRILMNKARDVLIKRNAGQAGQNVQQNGNGMQMGNNMQQPPSSQPGGSNFDFSSIMGQQANAIKQAESGEQVVPASNNNNGANNQMNVSQGVNPQMLGNQNNQPSSNPQFNAMQQQKQRQEQLQRQNQMARQQALAQQNQLRGQPGGLNPSNALNGGQVNSPNVANNSMNMLNRPMVPPGQATPSAPQPSQPQPMSQTPVNAASQLQQHHQNMLNQNNQQQQMNNGGGPNNTAVQQRWLNSLPQAARDKIAALPREQVAQILTRMHQTQLGNNGQGIQGMPGVPAGMNGAQAGNQQQLMTGPPQGLGNVGFNGQTPANQQSQQQQPANNSMMILQQSMAQHQQQAQQAQVRQKAMDLRPFPKIVLDNIGMSVPEYVNEWGKLKMHIMQNQQVLPPNTLEKVQTAQTQWFQAHPEEGQLALQALRQRMNGPQAGLQQQQQQQQIQQPQGNRPQSTAPMPNGQAPQAQMVPPTATMQQPHDQNNAASNMAQVQARMQPGVSADEIRLFREKMPQAQNMSDDMIRAAIMRRKADTMRTGQAAQAAQAQMQQNMRNNAQAQQRGQNLGNGAQQANMQQGNQQQRQQQAQRPQQPQQGARQPPNNQAQGQKRPQSNDDVVEIPNPNNSQAPQAPPMQANMSQGQQQAQMRLPTNEELTKMSPQERMVFQQRYLQREALKNVQAGFGQNGALTPGQQKQARPPQAQAHAQNQQQAQKAQPNAQQPLGPTTADGERMRAILSEVAVSTKKGRPVQLDSNGREQVQAILKKLWTPAMNIEKTLLTAYKQAGFSEDRIKQGLRAKLIVQHNARDSSGAERDYYSVTPEDLRKIEEFLRSYLHDIQQWKNRMLAAGAGGQPQAQNQSQDQAQTQAGAKPAPAQQPAPAKPAAKPQQQQQQQKAQPQAPALNRKQSQQGHNRKTSASSKVPQAPTEDKKFEWGASSPQGVPKYEVLRNDLTQANLKLPPKKKLKTDSQVSTPAGQATSTSPNAKAPSPEAARKGPPQPQAKAAEIERPKHKCEDPMCEASINGFETAELLSQHKTTAHQPVEDPLKYLLESAASALGVDQDGKPLPVPEEPKAAQPRGKPMAATLPVLKRDSRTPSIKQEVGTPATPASGVKGAIPKSTPTPATKQTADVKAVVDVPAKQPTLMDTMAEKIGFEMPVQEQEKPPAIAASGAALTDSNDAWLELFTHDLAGSAEDMVDDWSQWSGVTDWGLRPAEPTDSSPELTPSDVSSRESDISETQRLRINLEWDAFGNGDTGVPEGLMETLGLGEDAGMGDDNQKHRGDGGKVVDDQWDWSADLVEWDAMFDDGNGNGMDWSQTGVAT